MKQAEPKSAKAKEELLSEEEEDDEGVAEHLQDAVAGTLRLKRLLTQDIVDVAPSGKRRRREALPAFSAEQEAQISKLLKKWGMITNVVVRHVLEGCTKQELNAHMEGFWPDSSNEWRGPAELCAVHLAQCRERLGPGGSAMDCITAFRFPWKLDATADALMRKLSHKDLRYVLKTFDGTAPLADLVEMAAQEPPDEGVATGAAPEHALGSRAFGRFHRMELIDPTADAAVFGDANLGFALNLARHRNALGHVGRVIATTFENLETLRERYPEIDETIKELESYYSDVYHEVDCTRIAVDPRLKEFEHKFGAVYYNFPHAGAAWVDLVPGQTKVTGFYDSHPVVNWRHENLMKLFFRGLRYFVKPGGTVKVASNMGAVGVRFSYIIGSAVETIPFLEWTLHRYGRAYGDRRDKNKRPVKGAGYNDQKALSDMVYTFEFKPSGKALPEQNIVLPPNFRTIQSCQDGPFKGLNGVQTLALAKQLHERFVKECSGIHVG